MLNANAILLGLAFGLTQVNGHFTLQYPTTLGFDDSAEGTGPCGGFDPSFTKTQDFHIGGDAIAVTSTHPAAKWQYRATLDKTAKGNWTDFIPEVSQTGLGAFCEKGLTLPSSFAGQTGLIQIIQDAADGALYQCAAVNFVDGPAASVPSSCKNATGVTATFASGSTTESSTAESSTAATKATSTASAPSSSQTGAAMALGGDKVLGAIGAVVMLTAGLFALV